MNDYTLKPKPLRETDCTKTTEGHIRHLELFTDAGIILAPVMVRLCEETRRLIPVRRDGRLVYALPGGGEYQPT